MDRSLRNGPDLIPLAVRNSIRVKRLNCSPNDVKIQERFRTGFPTRRRSGFTVPIRRAVGAGVSKMRISLRRSQLVRRDSGRWLAPLRFLGAVALAWSRGSSGTIGGPAGGG